MTLKIILILLLLSGIASAQIDTSKTYFNKEFRISGLRDTLVNNVIRKKKFILKDLNTVKISGDTYKFGASDNKNIYTLHPDRIKTISIRDGSYFLPAMGYSALAGFGLGFLIGVLANGSKGSGHPDINFGSSEFRWGLGAGFAILFGVIGGLFGAGTPSFVDYDLTKNGMIDNDAELRKIIKKNFRK